LCLPVFLCSTKTKELRIGAPRSLAFVSEETRYLLRLPLCLLVVLLEPVERVLHVRLVASLGEAIEGVEIGDLTSGKLVRSRRRSGVQDVVQVGQGNSRAVHRSVQRVQLLLATGVLQRLCGTLA
jgi:hypothetical protein